MISTLKATARLSCCHGNIKLQTNGFVSKQNYFIQLCSLHGNKETAPDIQDYEPYSKLPYYDGKKGHLMYVGNMTKVVKGIKMFSISTSLVSVGSIPLIRSAIEESLTKAGVMGSISTLIFLTPLLLHFVTRKYVTDIYFNAETEVFTLATKSLLLRRKEVEYYSTDVEVPFVGGAFVTHRVKKRPYFIERELFFNKDVYVKMVGYDKPLEEFEKGEKYDEIQAKSVKQENTIDDSFGLFNSNKGNKSEQDLRTDDGNLNARRKENSSKAKPENFGLFTEKD